MSSDQLGPLVRLWGVPSSDLPPPAVSASDLAPFLIAILQEAVPFLDTIPSSSPSLPDTTRLWKSRGTSTSAPSAGPVHVLERTIPLPELELLIVQNQLTHAYSKGAKLHPETWACRRSVHEDARKPGTASWDEFVGALKRSHVESEGAFTPTVEESRTAMEWDCAGVEAEEGGVRWGDFTLKVVESRHRVGPLLNTRTFAVLQMTASAVGREDFIVVSIAVNGFGTSPRAEICREKKGQVQGSYTSVERVHKTEAGADIEWVMATTSDARGVLPYWLQAKAVPGQIAKDVGYFLSWAERERSKGQGDGRGEPSPSAKQESKGRTKKRGKEKTKNAQKSAEAPKAEAKPGDGDSSKASEEGGEEVKTGDVAKEILPGTASGSAEAGPPAVPEKDKKAEIGQPAPKE